MGRARLAAAACKPGGVHWHQLVDWTATTDPDNPTLGQYAIQHEWSRGTGHPTAPEMVRPHAHRWTEAALRRDLAGALSAADLELAVRALDGAWQTGPSVADRPGATEWLEDERAVAMTLHPELRPAGLRDA